MEFFTGSSQIQVTGPACGQLGELPAELRFIIWDFLLFGTWDNTPKSLGILSRSNRALHNEVWSYVHRHISHFLVLRSVYKADWRVRITRGKLKHYWNFQKRSTLRKYIAAFLRANATSPHAIRIAINPSHSNDRGRIVCLWRKTDELADILKESLREHTAPVYVELVGRWTKGGKPMHSTHYYQDTPDDHDIVALPFLQLGAYFHIPPQLSRLISQQPNKKTRSILYKGLSEPNDDSWQSVRFDQDEATMLINAMGNVMDVMITLCSGSTGHLLRRDRSKESKFLSDSNEVDSNSNVSSPATKECIETSCSCKRYGLSPLCTHTVFRISR